MLRHALADVGVTFVAILEAFWCLLNSALPQGLYLVLLLRWVTGI